MEIIIKDTDNLQSGAYILNANGEEQAPVHHSSHIFLTQSNNSSLKNEILALINESKEVLKICSFIITDEEIFSALYKKARHTNTAIFILTQLDDRKLADKFTLLEYLTEEEVSQNSAQIHLGYIKELYDNGVHVRASASIHAKFICTDRAKGFITSANLTSPSLNLNTESGVYLNEKSSRELDVLFDLIFKLGTTYKQFITSNRKGELMVVQTVTQMKTELLPSPSDSSLRYTYENDTNNLYDEIVQIVNEASDYLYLSTYSIVKLQSLTKLTGAIKNARSRGVEINIFCRGMNYRNDHLEGSQLLSSIGCNIFGDLFNHSKGIISEKNGLLFTANIDGVYGLTSGMEVGYILSETERVEFLNIHRMLIKSAFYIFIDRPVLRTFFDTYEYYESVKEIKAPGFPADLTITIKQGLLINDAEFKNCPLFYGRLKQENYLIAGNVYYKCMITGGNTFDLIEKASPNYAMEKHLLKYTKLKIIFN